MKLLSIKVADIETSAGTQIRARIDLETVDEYATAMQGNSEFPPVVVFHDGNRYILADGFHRVMAAARNASKSIKADVRKGTKSDALKFALSANTAHGLRRTNADKRRSVDLALAEWPKLSDREIARICAVGPDMVGDVRKSQLSNSDSSPEPEKRTGADGKTRRVPRKRKRSRTLPPPPSETEEPPEVETADEELNRLAVQESNLQTLKSCWSLADCTHRTAFRQWIDSNEGKA